MSTVVNGTWGRRRQLRSRLDWFSLFGHEFHVDVAPMLVCHVSQSRSPLFPRQAEATSTTLQLFIVSDISRIDTILSCRAVIVLSCHQCLSDLFGLHLGLHNFRFQLLMHVAGTECGNIAVNRKITKGVEYKVPRSDFSGLRAL